MLHLELNHTSSDLTIFFLHKQPLSLITSYSLLSTAHRPVKAFYTTAPHCSTVTVSGTLNVWITVSWARPPEWQWVETASPPYLGHATVDSGSRPAGVDQSVSKALICYDTLTLPLEDVRALGNSPTALPIAARVMQGVREAGMDGGTGYGRTEVNGLKEGECWDAGSAEERKWIWEGIRRTECGIKQIRTIS